MEFDESFANLDRHIHILNKITSIGDFVSDVCPALLKHARSIATKEESETALERVVPEISEKARLLSLAKSKKQKHFSFLKSSDGIARRLKIQPHLQMLTSFIRQCALCGGEKARR